MPGSFGPTGNSFFTSSMVGKFPEKWDEAFSTTGYCVSAFASAILDFLTLTQERFLCLLLTILLRKSPTTFAEMHREETSAKLYWSGLATSREIASRQLIAKINSTLSVLVLPFFAKYSDCSG